MAATSGHTDGTMTQIELEAMDVPNNTAASSIQNFSTYNASENDLPLESDADKAAEYNRKEHELTFWEAIKLHYPALLWALLVNLATVCQGLDGQVVGALVGIESFRRHYGVAFDHEIIIQAHWLGAFNYAGKAGSIVGAFCAGIAYERLGIRRVIAFCSALSIASVSVQFFAHHPLQLVIGLILNGCATSFYVVCATAYVSEVCPLVLRGVAASAINALLVAGQLIGSGVLKIGNSIDSEWGYKFPLASQWPLPVIMLLFTLTPYLPNPPFWLCKRGEYKAAERSIQRLATRDVDPTFKLAFIRETLRLEGEAKHGARSSLWECFRGTDRRRLVICLMAYAIQALIGAVLFHDFAVYFFELAGLSANDAFSMNIGVNAIGFVGACAAWWFLQFLGRRSAYIWGCAILASLQGFIGILDLIPRPAAGSGTSPSSWGQSALAVVCNLVYDVTVGPYCFVLLSEVSSARLRGMNIGLATMVYQGVAIGFAMAVPFLINEDQAAMGGKIAFIFAGLGGLCTLYCFFCLPETKDRTFEELGHMFAAGLPSRKFGEFEMQHSREVVVVEGEANEQEDGMQPRRSSSRVD
ncbi:Maltose permease MAL31 [Cytospora mali]|uniref:Maltose permease MAL31 n=1 Tax=Cytospora mali TaxID=578113 RepID=A0A194UNY4_CYTMA|nr:Maltose permease MAL31 [Valsa mali var. pyri (nom. inval.)]